MKKDMLTVETVTWGHVDTPTVEMKEEEKGLSVLLGGGGMRDLMIVGGGGEHVLFGDWAEVESMVSGCQV